MEEIWKPVKGYEGYYEVSNMGRVRSCDRYVKHYSKQRFYKGKLLAENEYPNGYKYVNLNKDGIHKTALIHRLVAVAFLPNPNNFPEVNHRDENFRNNELTNLEWCTSKYNANYGTRMQKCSNPEQRRPIIQLSKEGMFIKRWNGIGEASKALGIDDSHIIRVCKHMKRNVTAGGFKWEYAE